jgi:hypothetical protein
LRGPKSVIDNLGNDYDIEIKKADGFSVVTKKIPQTDREKAKAYDKLKDQVLDFITTITRTTTASMLLMTGLTDFRGIAAEYPFIKENLGQLQEPNYLGVESAESSANDIENFNLGFRSAFTRLLGSKIYTDICDTINYNGIDRYGSEAITSYKTLKDFAGFITDLSKEMGSVGEACRLIAQFYLMEDGSPVGADSLKVEYSRVINQDYVNDINYLIDSGLDKEQAIEETSKRTRVRTYELRQAYDKHSLK